MTQNSFSMLEPNFSPFPELRTERLLLRQLNVSDAAAMFAMRSDERVLKYIGREPHQNIEQSKSFIESINTNISNNESVLWGIAYLNEPSKIIGTICYWRLEPSNYRAEIGYALQPDHWGKGVMKEAIETVLEYGFGPMKLHSVEARTTPANISSCSVLEKTGFVKEGHLKEEFCFREQFYDTIIYSRLQ